MRRFSPVVPTLLMLLGFLAAVPLGQQRAPQRPIPRFGTGVELVLLDVSVLDGDRMPVRGLARDDFTVLEDGKPQRLESFTAIDLPDIVEQEPAPAAPWLRDVAPDVRRNDDAPDRRIVVIVIDDASPIALGESSMVARLARRAIENLQPDDLAAVVYSFNKRAGQEFTQDRARLLAAVARSTTTGAPTSEGGAADTLERAAAIAYRASLGTLRGVAESLEAMPNRRKAIFWVSAGVGLDWSQAMMGEISLTNPESASRSGDVQEMIMLLRELLAAAQRANATVYALDPGGLRAPVAPKIETHDRDVDVARKTLAALRPNVLNVEFLKTVANETGGFAAVETNDPAPAIRQAFRENSSYYLLGYAPANARADGRYRKVEVRVNRPGVTVRARSGYFEEQPGRSRREPSAADAALAASLPKSDLAMQVTAAPFGVPGKRNATVAVVLGVHTNAPRRATRVVQQIDLRVAAFGTDGRQKGGRRETVPVTFNLPGTGGMLGYEVLTRFDLPPGRYQLRVAAESSFHGIQLAPSAPPVALLSPGQDTGNRAGSVFFDLDVPDFANARVALSGLLLAVTPPVASGPKDRLAPLLSVVPTSLRDFTADDEVNVFLRVYQGGTAATAPVTLHARVLDERNATVFESHETLAAERFGAARAADWWLAIPIARLAGGPHLLRVEAVQDDVVVRRDLRFRVR